LNTFRFLERLRVQKSQLRSAIAHDDVLTILRQRPSLAVVLELPFQSESREVENESDVRFPRQADEMALPVDDTLAEKLGRDGEFLHYLARIDSHLANS